MRNAHMQKLVNEFLVVMTEGEVEVCHRYVTSETEAKKLVEKWKDGTLRLLTET
jgi:hypothetical protein